MDHNDGAPATVVEPGRIPSRTSIGFAVDGEHPAPPPFFSSSSSEADGVGSVKLALSRGDGVGRERTGEGVFRFFFFPAASSSSSCPSPPFFFL